MISNLIKIGFVNFLLLSLMFSSEQIEFNIGSAKHDYSNVNFSYKGKEGIF